MPANQTPKQSTVRGGVLLALGIVFGDIGTSPLYAFETAVGAAGGTAQAALGVASLIVWTLMLVVTVKYGMIVMRAQYQGEGGVFALMALLRKTPFLQSRRGPWISGMLVVGAALLFGDGAITPAISVLSAVEGIEAIHPDLANLALPAALVILTCLFVAQRFGTGNLGWIFGPVMAVWFASLAVMGVFQIFAMPSVLAALSPIHGLNLLMNDGARSAAIIGSVVLAVTGAEALYADMGHFGRPAILHAWRLIVFPALILNYLGQAAYVLRFPAAATDENLFFLLVPVGGLREGMVLLATAATVIASQALISGAFSLTNQAIDLGYLPRFFVKHTSAATRGQIYIPLVNYILGGVCIMLVLGFRTSSALAGAYGIAVTGAMIITSIGFVSVVVLSSRRPKWQAALLLAGLLAIDLPLFLSCLSKLFEGGIVPVALAAAVTIMMITWRKGRDLVHESMAFGAVSVEELGKRLDQGIYRRTPCTQIFVVRKPIPDQAVASILEQYRRVKVIGEKLVILLLNPAWDDAFNPIQSVNIRKCGDGFWVVSAAHGFMVEPDAPGMMRQAVAASDGGFDFVMEDSFFVTAREVIMADSRRLMPSWQRHLLAFMSRNVTPGPDYLKIPPDRLLVYNWMLRV
jgi:KUP system potassium uptake protein